MPDYSNTRSTYEEIADEYTERHADREDVTQLVENYLPYVEGERVLDVGCGPGWESSTFSERGYDVVGIDITKSFIEKACSNSPDSDFALMDMQNLGFFDDVFDAVWACASFLHVPRENAVSTLEGFGRVLRPGGSLYVSVKHGSGERVSDAYEDDERVFVYYDADEFRANIEKAGFEVEEIRDGDWIQAIATFPG